jgi:hypothetical protein
VVAAGADETHKVATAKQSDKSLFVEVGSMEVSTESILGCLRPGGLNMDQLIEFNRELAIVW